MVRLLRLTLLLSALLALGGSVARAATITVNALGDGPTGCTLRAAVEDADAPGLPAGPCTPATSGANTILLGSGTFSLTQLSQLIIAAGADVTIAGSGEGETAISGDGATRIFTVLPGATLRLRDLTLSNGLAPTRLPPGDGSGADGDDGGAIANAGTLVFVDGAVIASSAGDGGASAAGTGGGGGDGGAIFNVGTATLSGISFIGDDAGEGGAGGSPALATDGTGTPPVGGQGGSGGAIANIGGAMTISDSTFTDDVAGAGGEGYSGIAIPGAASGGGDGGNGGNGGAIVTLGGSVSLTNATLTANSAGVGGSGGAGGAGGLGGSGGGVAVEQGAALTLQSDTIADNSAVAAGGGIYAPAVAAGDAGAAVGISAADTLLAANVGGNCTTSSLVDLGGNLSFGDTTCPATFLAADPQLEPLEINGGPADTMRLAPGSAAIGHGIDCPATDERGIVRGGVCSIGAFQAAPPAVRVGSTSTSATSAQIHAQVLVNAGAATVTVHYWSGATKSKVVTVALGPYSGPMPVTLVLTRLAPRSRYRFTLSVTTVDGSATTPPQQLTTGAAAPKKHRGSRRRGALAGL